MESMLRPRSIVSRHTVDNFGAESLHAAEAAIDMSTTRRVKIVVHVVEPLPSVRARRRMERGMRRSEQGSNVVTLRAFRAFIMGPEASRAGSRRQGIRRERDEAGAWAME